MDWSVTHFKSSDGLPPTWLAELPPKSVVQLLKEHGISYPPKAAKEELENLLHEKAVKVR